MIDFEYELFVDKIVFIEDVCVRREIGKIRLIF